MDETATFIWRENKASRNLPSYLQLRAMWWNSNLAEANVMGVSVVEAWHSLKSMPSYLGALYDLQSKSEFSDEVPFQFSHPFKFRPEY